MLDIFGRQYVIDYCVPRWAEDYENKLFRIYVTDGIKNINESIAGFLGGRVFKGRYYDMIKRGSEEEPKETAEDIKERIKTKLAALEE